MKQLDLFENAGELTREEVIEYLTTEVINDQTGVAEPEESVE